MADLTRTATSQPAQEATLSQAIGGAESIVERIISTLTQNPPCIPMNEAKIAPASIVHADIDRVFSLSQKLEQIALIVERI